MRGVQGCRTDDRTDSLLGGQAGCGGGWLGSAEQVSCQLAEVRLPVQRRGVKAFKAATTSVLLAAAGAGATVTAGRGPALLQH
jgi:hypothetical protein